jgi:hypothetical protein
MRGRGARLDPAGLEGTALSRYGPFAAGYYLRDTLLGLRRSRRARHRFLLAFSLGLLVVAVFLGLAAIFRNF